MYTAITGARSERFPLQGCGCGRPLGQAAPESSAADRRTLWWMAGIGIGLLVLTGAGDRIFGLRRNRRRRRRR